MSDLHIGGAFTVHERIEQDLKLAEQSDATILVNGDLFDAILPGDRKRYTPTALHPRLQNRADILNESLNWAFEILEPYKHRIGFLGVGNHDTALEKHHSVDLVSVLCDKLNVPYGGYCGYYRQSWTFGKRRYHTMLMRYHHGAGGSSPVTKGIIEFQRMAAWIDGNTDIVWLGHKHNRMVDDSVTREHVNKGGRLIYKPVLNVMTASYMRAYVQQKETPRRASYAADRNLAPQVMGGVMLTVTIHKEEAKYEAYGI